MGWGVFVDEGDTHDHFQSTCCDLTPLGAYVLKDEMDAGISTFYLGKLSPCPGHTTFHCVQMLLKCCWWGQSRIKSCFCLLSAGYCFFFPYLQIQITSLVKKTPPTHFQWQVRLEKRTCEPKFKTESATLTGVVFFIILFCLCGCFCLHLCLYTVGLWYP